MNAPERVNNKINEKTQVEDSRQATRCFVGGSEGRICRGADVASMPLTIGYRRKIDSLILTGISNSQLREILTPKKNIK